MNARSGWNLGCWLLGLAACCAMFAGCGHAPPKIAPLSGIVLLNDVPLPNAYVEFVPQLEHFGAEYNSSATTDAQGRFTLTCHFGGQSGAALGPHRVTVTEPPASDEFRGMDGESQAKYGELMRSQPNRPIPVNYGSVLATPLIVEVKPNEPQVELRLVR